MVDREASGQPVPGVNDRVAGSASPAPAAASTLEAHPGDGRGSAPTIEAARIASRQTIVVAAITGVVSVITTVLATRAASPSDHKPSPGSEAALTGRTAEDAVSHLPVNRRLPIMRFGVIPTTLSAEDCSRRAVATLHDRNFTGVEMARYDSGTFVKFDYTWGYFGKQNEIGALIWCATDSHQVTFVATGPSDDQVSMLVTQLRRSF